VRRSSRDRLIAALVVAGVGGAALAADAWRPFAGPEHPDEWDTRVIDAVSVVEDATDRRFEHPVSVTLRTDEEFEAEIRTDDSDLDDDDRSRLADTEALGRALGLLEGQADLFEEQNDLRGAGILAYYSYTDREIVIRLPEGDTAEEIITFDDLPVDLRATVVHEMVHALQDQLYDLAELQSSAEDDNQSSAILSLIEGHAVWVERFFVQDVLDDDERAEYMERNTSAVEEFETETSQVSAVLSATQGLPYATGPALIAVLDATGGADAIEKAFTDEPPVAEDQVLLPSAYLDGDQPEEITEPDVPDGADEVASGQLGAPTIYLMLSTALPAPEALAAIAGWGNDEYVSYRDDDRLCVAAHLVGDTDADTEVLHEALSSWDEQRPEQADTAIKRSDGTIQITACDPGTDVAQDVPTDDAVAQIFGRSQDITFLVGDGQDPAAAECLADALYTAFPVSVFQEEQLPAEVSALVAELSSSC
jgi:hypothetical protein